MCLNSKNRQENRSSCGEPLEKQTGRAVSGMEEPAIDDSVKRKLNMQNEVLKWLEDFSEKLQKRADAATVEVHGLLEQTGVVEQDLKNVFNSFRCLSYGRYIENKISDEDEMTTNRKEDQRNSLQSSIPAQSYEADILPRYKEALSMGLSSYKHHLQKTYGTASTGSVFRIGSAWGPLPHIIGSEEYIHDNSCGLPIDEFTSDAGQLDFGLAASPSREYSSSSEPGSHAVFDSDLFGTEQGPSIKDGDKPLVSAALDFKAMLEAALLSSYKFYDEGSPSLPDTMSGYKSNSEHLHSNLDEIMPAATTAIATSSTGVDDATARVPHAGGNLAFFPDLDIHSHKLQSALFSESLFDTEEESLPSSQKQSDCIPTSAAEVANYAKLSLTIQESYVVHSSNENEATCIEAPPEVAVALGERIASTLNSLSSSDAGEVANKFSESASSLTIQESCEVSSRNENEPSNLEAPPEVDIAFVEHTASNLNSSSSTDASDRTESFKDPS